METIMFNILLQESFPYIASQKTHIIGMLMYRKPIAISPDSRITIDMHTNILNIWR